jgi:hypothetical protein
VIDADDRRGRDDAGSQRGATAAWVLSEYTQVKYSLLSCSLPGGPSKEIINRGGKKISAGSGQCFSCHPALLPEVIVSLGCVPLTGSGLPGTS